jgi:hypothetical protein
MSKEINENFDQQINEVINPWDNLIIQINNGDKVGAGAIRMMKQDLDTMMDLHKASRGEILDLLLKTVETTPPENFEQK